MRTTSVLTLLACFAAGSVQAGDIYMARTKPALKLYSKAAESNVAMTAGYATPGALGDAGGLDVCVKAWEEAAVHALRVKDLGATPSAATVLAEFQLLAVEPDPEGLKDLAIHWTETIPATVPGGLGGGPAGCANGTECWGTARLLCQGKLGGETLGSIFVEPGVCTVDCQRDGTKGYAAVECP